MERASHTFFAATMIAVGAIGLLSGGFAAILAGVPKSLPDRQVLAHFADLLLLACGAGLLVKRTAAPAAFVLLAYLLVWTILFKVPLIIRQPMVEVGYQTNGENAVLIAAAGVLYAASAGERKNALLNLIASPTGLRAAYVLYGLALIAFGLSHFAYMELTAPLVPVWLPGHMFWAYLTGSIYLLTGILLVAGFAMRLSAALAAVQITLITLLVWGPILLQGHVTTFHWQETVVSWALTAAAWVIAASFDGRPWVLQRGTVTRPIAA